MSEKLQQFPLPEPGPRVPRAEWPPNPKIGELSVETLETRGEDGKEDIGALYELVWKIYGLRKEDIFKTAPSGRVWTESILLKIAVLSLEGWTNEKLAAFVNKERPTAENEEQKSFSGADVAVAKTKYITDEIKELVRASKKRLTETRSTGETMERIAKTRAETKEREGWPKRQVWIVSGTFNPNMFPFADDRGQGLVYSTEPTAVRIEHMYPDRKFFPDRKEGYSSEPTPMVLWDFKRANIYAPSPTLETVLTETDIPFSSVNGEIKIAERYFSSFEDIYRMMLEQNQFLYEGKDGGPLRKNGQVNYFFVRGKDGKDCVMGVYLKPPLAHLSRQDWKIYERQFKEGTATKPPVRTKWVYQILVSDMKSDGKTGSTFYRNIARLVYPEQG